MLSFAVSSILNLSRLIISRFLWVMIIIFVAGLDKAILNLMMHGSDEKSWFAISDIAQPTTPFSKGYNRPHTCKYCGRIS